MSDKVDSSIIQKAADMLQQSYDSGIGCTPVRELLPEGDIDAAYEVQEVNTKRRLASGARLVGRKIGLTSKLVQKQHRLNSVKPFKRTFRPLKPVCSTV